MEHAVKFEDDILSTIGIAEGDMLFFANLIQYKNLQGTDAIGYNEPLLSAEPLQISRRIRGRHMCVATHTGGCMIIVLQRQGPL
jgi:hypothetical protein